MTIRNCADCGRPLAEGEGKYCPACRARHTEHTSKVMRVLKFLGVAIVVVGTILKFVIEDKPTSRKQSSRKKRR
jgi:uncharacterized Zn finger protein (UPF0148 family)